MKLKGVVLIVAIFVAWHGVGYPDHWISVNRDGRILGFTHLPRKPATEKGMAWVFVKGDPLPEVVTRNKYDWSAKTIVAKSQAEIDITTSAEKLPEVKAALLKAQGELSQAQLLEEPALISSAQLKLDQLKAEYQALKLRAAGGN